MKVASCVQPTKLLFYRVALSLVLHVSWAAVPSSAQTLQFLPGTPVQTSLAPLYALTADLNQDGCADLLVTSTESGGLPSHVYVFLGNCDGTFKTATSYPVGTAGLSSPAAPVLVSRIPPQLGPTLFDLIVPMAASNSVNVLLGNPDGSFQPFTSYTADAAPTAVTVADFNRDSFPDLAVTATGPLKPGVGNLSSISLLLGRGDGTYAPATVMPLAVNAFPSSIVVRNFRNSDLAVGTSAGIGIFTSKGDGTFSAEVDYPLPSPTRSLAVADFNGDSFPDLAAVRDSAISILLGNTDGTFQPPRNIVAGNGEKAIAIADFNGDMKPDLVVANYADNTFSVLLGSGDGTFQPALTFPTIGIGPRSLAVADFNGDGAEDVAVVTTNGATVGSPASTFIFLNVRGAQGTLTSSANPVQFGNPVTFTAEVTPLGSGQPVPTGQVTFYFDFYAIAPGPVPLDATGTAQITTYMGFTLPNLIRARYSGDKNYNPRYLPAMVQSIIDLSIFPNPSSATVTAGMTAKFTLSIHQTGGLSGPINFTCAGAPPAATCSVAPNPLTLTGSSADVTVTVATSGASLAANATPRFQGSTLPWIWTLWPASVALMAAHRSMLKGGKRRWSCATLMATLLMLSLCACGGGNSARTPSGPVTPAGNYTLTVTAASATTPNITQSQNLSLTVTH